MPNSNTACDTSIVQHIESGIANLILNRPEKRNAFGRTMIEELIQAISQLEKRNDIRCLILKSAGQHFSAGADLNWMKEMIQFNHEQNLQDAKQLALLMELLFRFPKPTLCLVQGCAYGGALGLIACCDIAVATYKSEFCFSEVRLGLAPAVISPYITHRVGQNYARRYFLTAEKFDAKIAFNMGLIHETVNPEDLENEGIRLASCLLDAAPNALEETKSLLNHIIIGRTPYDKSVTDYTTNLIARLRVSPEGQEGLTSFFEKRAPTWQKDI